MSEPLQLLEGLAGIALILTVLSDVFRSVVLPRASRRSLRLGPAIGALTLRALLAARRGRTRGGIPGSFGPLLIVAEMLIWVGLLILGYALVLHATDGLKPHADLVDALYAAGSAFVTTGLSGQEAATPQARAIIVLAGFSGLAVVTLVVTFLLSIQSALHRREALVIRLRARVGPGPSGVHLLATLTRIGPGRDAALPDFFQEWEAWAADVLLTHRAFPILVYFRSTDEDCGWMAALGAVLDAAALLVVIGHEDACEHALVCHRMGARLIADLARQFGMHAPFAPGLDRAAFQDGLDRLATAGYHADRDPAITWPEFQHLRSQHSPPLRLLTTRFGEPAAAW